MASSDKPVGYPVLVEKVISWVVELRERLETSAVRVSEVSSLEDYLQWIIKEAEEDTNRRRVITDKQVLAADQEGEEDNDDSGGMRKVANNLCLAAIHHYLNDTEQADRILDELMDINDTNTPNGRAFKILRNTFVPKEADDFFGVNVVENGGDAKLDATLMNMKGVLGRLMGVPEELVLELHLKSVEKDPECHLWYHFAYRTLRRMRRNEKRSIDCKLGLPSKQERDLAEKAYRLSKGQALGAITDYAVMLKESLWTLPHHAWKQNPDYEKALDLFQ